MVSGRGAEHHAMALALRRDIGDRFPAEGRPADSLVSFQCSASIQRRMGVGSRERGHWTAPMRHTPPGLVPYVTGSRPSGRCSTPLLTGVVGSS